MDYLAQAKQAVERLHKCIACHVETVHVCTRAGETVWTGNVEVFALEGFVGADCCYVWGFELVENSGKFDFVSVPATGSAVTPTAAVQAVLDWDEKHGRQRTPLPFPFCRPTELVMARR